MAKEQPAAAGDLKSIEQHAQALKVPAWQLEGLKAANRWAQGRTLTEKDFSEALKNWLAMPMSGKG